MRDLKDIQKENVEFLREEESRIAARLALLPKGRIRLKKVGDEAYYYLQYRKNRTVKTDYIGKEVPAWLRDNLAERERLRKELRRVREGLRLLRSGRTPEANLTEPLLAILRKLTEKGLWDAGLEIIGSWCFLLYQRHLPMKRYPMRTVDLDILVPWPYRGKPFDLAAYLQRLGFSQNFHPDGSMFFTGNRMKVEFLTRERRETARPQRYVKEIAVTPQELRFLDILFVEPRILKVDRGIRAKVPDPSAFLLHKLIIATRSERRNKKEKDIRQAVYTANFVLAEKSETAKLVELWAGLPRKWKARIKRSLSQAMNIVPLEKGIIERLQYLLV
jgi:hypothetical protein